MHEYENLVKHLSEGGYIRFVNLTPQSMDAEHKIDLA